MLTTSAIIVTYFPELPILKKLLKSLEEQVEQIIIVDNGSSEEITRDIEQLVSRKDIFISNQNNLGVATAINIGIQQAEKNSTSHIIIFDQDSLPAKNMIKTMLAVMNEKIQLGYRVAAAGPNYSDDRGSYVSPFVKLMGFKLCRVICNKDEVVEVDHLISSGCLISKDVLSDIGNMNDKLFIDYVDTEWCLRAIYKGYSLLGVGSAYMQHSLGDRVIRRFGRNVHVHSSLRYYYLIRNGFWLLLQPWVSAKWRFMDLYRLFRLYLFYSFFVEDKYKNWKMMNKGLWHGLMGKMGKIEEDL